MPQISQTFEINFITERFLVSSTQLPFSVKEQLQYCFPNQGSNSISDFATVKAFLDVIYIINVKNIFSYASETVIGRCCEIYALEVNAKPATKDRNSFIIDVGGSLYLPLLPTELSQ